jgi:hypothetical protein
LFWNGGGVGDIAVAAQLTISNEHCAVSYDTASGRLGCVRSASTGLFAESQFGGKKRIDAKVSQNRIQGLGACRSIEIMFEDTRLQISVVPGVPFVFFRPYVKNPGNQELRIEKLEALEFTVLPDTPIETLRALGTAGLTPVDIKAATQKRNKLPARIPATGADPSGSYMFLAVANPQTRGGVVSGWTSSDRGSGIVFNYAEKGRTRIRAQVDYGRLIVPPKSETASEIFVVGAFDDGRLGLEAYADTIAKYYEIKLPAQLDGYCTWYSKPNGGSGTEENILELAEAAKEKLVPYGFDFVQIDDKWQDGVFKDGPRMVFSQHRNPGPYPNGMKAVAEKLKALGITPGIWWIPFGGKHFDPFFADKQDLFVKNEDGTPRAVKWGGTVLDLTRPETLDYVGSNAKLLAHDWGYDYFKLDGLWVGVGTELQYRTNEYQGNDKLGYGIVYDPKVTPIEAYRNGLRTVRKAAGKPIFILGCNTSQNVRSMGASFGLVDAMRVGPDNNTEWMKLLDGPWHAGNRYFLHGRVWYNDPDPLYVRNDMPLEHAQLICSWVSISGALNVFSEWLPGLKPERVALLQRTLPSHGLAARPVDLFENGRPNAWTLRDPNSDRTIVALFNWSEKESATLQYEANRLGLPAAKRYETFEFWTARPGEILGSLSYEIPAASCRVFSVRPAKSYPQVISTSRHLTQGIVAFHGERWDGDNKTLCGTCDVVANDPYEVRVLLPSREGRVDGVSTDSSVQADWKQEGRLVRINLKSVETRPVRWSLKML